MTTRVVSCWSIPSISWLSVTRCHCHFAIVIPGIISTWCWMIKRSVCLLKQISYAEIISTCSAATSYGCGSSGVFYAVDSATLQPVHRCTPAPDGMLAVPAVLPTVFVFVFLFCGDTCSQFAFSQCPQLWLKHFHFILLQETIKRAFVELAVSVMEVGVVFILCRQLFQPLRSLIWSIASIFLSLLFLQWWPIKCKQEHNNKIFQQQTVQLKQHSQKKEKQREKKADVHQDQHGHNIWQNHICMDSSKKKSKEKWCVTFFSCQWHTMSPHRKCSLSCSWSRAIICLQQIDHFYLCFWQILVCQSCHCRTIVICSFMSIISLATSAEKDSERNLEEFVEWHDNADANCAQPTLQCQMVLIPWSLVGRRPKELFLIRSRLIFITWSVEAAGEVPLATVCAEAQVQPWSKASSQTSSYY